MQVNDARGSSSVSEPKEKVAITLARLKSLKDRVSKLRAQCEALKELRSENKEGVKCSDCGKVIEQGQEVTFKNSFGEIKGCYHIDCFREIWRSQNWSFDYSSPGFLKMQ
jgi:hypothetical protein